MILKAQDVLKKGKHLQKKVPSWKQTQIEKDCFGLEKEKASI